MNVDEVLERFKEELLKELDKKEIAKALMDGIDNIKEEMGLHAVVPAQLANTYPYDEVIFLGKERSELYPEDYEKILDEVVEGDRVRLQLVYRKNLNDNALIGYMEVEGKLKLAAHSIDCQVKPVFELVPVRTKEYRQDWILGIKFKDEYAGFELWGGENLLNYDASGDPNKQMQVYALMDASGSMIPSWILKLTAETTYDAPFILFRDPNKKTLEKIPLREGPITELDIPKEALKVVFQFFEANEGAGGPGTEYEWILSELEDHLGKGLAGLIDCEELAKKYYEAAKNKESFTVEIDGKTYELTPALTGIYADAGDFEQEFQTTVTIKELDK
jgi:hypothetical protein